MSEVDQGMFLGGQRITGMFRHVITETVHRVQSFIELSFRPDVQTSRQY